MNSDRRDAPRYSLVVQVDYLGAHLGPRDVSKDLSASGLFVRTDRSFKVGERLMLVLSFPKLLTPLQLTVEVMRLQPGSGPDSPAGVGLRVPETCIEDRKKLKAFVAQFENPSGKLAPDLIVLIVEDNPLLATMYADTLQALRREARLAVEFATDGLAALNRLGQTPTVDLLITDLIMPKLDGFELIKRVRENDATYKLPIVVVSSGGQAVEARSTNLGANAFLRKPLKLQDLLATLDTLMKAAR